VNRGVLAILAFAFPVMAYAQGLPQAECLIAADWRLQAGEALRAGISKERHLAAQENVSQRRAIVEEVYRAGPSDLSDYIAARLGACLRSRGAEIGDRVAKACYDQTLWAGMFFGSKRRGDSLERLSQFYGGALAELAEAVYRSQLPELQFRQDLFADCLSRS
jgi:hypothetical protein